MTKDVGIKLDELLHNVVDVKGPHCGWGNCQSDRWVSRRYDRGILTWLSYDWRRRKHHSLWFT